jgi:hypothetical protein
VQVLEVRRLHDHDPDPDPGPEVPPDRQR